MRNKCKQTVLNPFFDKISQLCKHKLLPSCRRWETQFSEISSEQVFRFYMISNLLNFWMRPFVMEKQFILIVSSLITQRKSWMLEIKLRFWEFRKFYLEKTYSEYFNKHIAPCYAHSRQMINIYWIKIITIYVVVIRG